ncbi:MAG: hypothetical protein GF334_01585 [Candidatus Altiarchaeales archaeon]|nr:hypothetical protein [Candidatus Altiarchaeales archaeon]
MVFIPRDPVVQNQFLVHDSSKGTTATAGAAVSLSASEKVETVSGSNTKPYGFLMQNVKAESSAHPTGFQLPGDLGSSDAFTGDPVGVAHLGLYDTTHYDTTQTYTAGDQLQVAADGKVTPSGSGNELHSDVVAVAQNTLDSNAVSAGRNLRIKLLI